MSKKTLEALRAAFNKTAREGGEGGTGGNWYPFWNMKEGERAVVRFIPDKNEDNPFGFVVQKAMHTLTVNGEDQKVSCLSNYGEDCPICKVSADFYKVDDKVNGKKYWKKKQYVAQAIIVEDPLPPDQKTGETHKGQLRLISLGPQIYQIIQDAFKSDDELEAIPYDLDEGYDFVIKKSKQGEYASYAIGTKFTKQRSLNEDEFAVVEEKQLDLSTIMPKHPGREKVEALLEASLTGSSYDTEDDGFTSPAPKKSAAKPAARDDDEEDTPTPARSSKKPAWEDEEETDSEDDSEDEAPAPRRAKVQGSTDDATVNNLLGAIRGRRA